MSQALLSSTYFGPVQWYQKLYRYDKVQVEACDNFIKQTYRNRCVIAAANGLQALTVPVERTADDNMDANGAQPGKCLMKDVRISDHGNWRHLHWNALTSAYGESPFFEFYADDIRPFFERKWTFLYDFNAEICAKMCELIGRSRRGVITRCTSANTVSPPTSAYSTFCSIWAMKVCYIYR